jgi:hypothetical protein
MKVLASTQMQDIEAALKLPIADFDFVTFKANLQHIAESCRVYLDLFARADTYGLDMKIRREVFWKASCPPSTPSLRQYSTSI